MIDTNLDIRTLLFITILFSLVYSVILYFIKDKGNKFSGIKVLALSIFITGIGSYLRLLENTPDWLSIVSANMSICIAYAVMNYGINIFCKSNSGNYKLLYSLLPLMAASFAYYTYFEPSVSNRVIWFSWYLAVALLLTIQDLLKGKEEDDPHAKKIISLIFFSFSVFMIFRGFWAFEESELKEFLDAGTIHQLTIVGMLSIIVATSYIMLWMMNVRLVNEIKTQALLDPLTSTFNRRALVNLSNSEILRAKRYKTKLSIIMADVDFFKKINDGYGHQVGDSVLVKIASVLKNSIRVNDSIFRYGGEEFLILLPSSSLKEATMVAEKIQVTLNETTLSENKNINLTLSFGISELSDKDDLESLIYRADQALLTAKNEGRNKIIVS